jgi:peptidoglycan-N-acetylglucosamine deacetylase
VPAPIVSVSVDLDSIECYFRIHGLPDVPVDETRYIILRRCLPRLAELFARHNLRSTLFVVGRDLHEDSQGRALLADLAQKGHELASHTYAHPYDLVRLPAERIAEEIDGCHAAIAEIAQPPRGFRAPGYEISTTVIETLCQRGYRYDSSTFPAVPYYLAKATVMGGMRLLGRRSGSILGSPAVLGAPRDPYRPAQKAVYRRGEREILELPVSVTRGLRLPVIGTSIIMAPEWLRRSMVGSVLAGGFFNLELHGIDLADAQADGFPKALIAKQPDLRVPLAKKLEVLDATLRQAEAAGARFMPLLEAAAELG